MSKFIEIQQQFNSLRDAEDAYWARLDAAQSEIRRGLAEFLGVDADEQSGGESRTPKIYFGGAPSAFGGKSGDETVREENELVFTLNVVLDSVERRFPPNVLRLRCRVKYVAENYMFFLEGAAGIYITVKEDFTPVYEHLYKTCSEVLSKYSRL
jgi:hypothetical protein